MARAIKNTIIILKILKMEMAKKLAIDLLVITAGVLIALKIKESMSKAKLTMSK
jgi:hypothetical protein